MRQDILGLVYSAIDEVNAQSADGTAIAKTPETRLLGGDRGLDSLTFVNLVVALEEQIQSGLGQAIVLVDEDSMGLQEHPFRTVKAPHADCRREDPREATTVIEGRYKSFNRATPPSRLHAQRFVGPEVSPEMSTPDYPNSLTVKWRQNCCDIAANSNGDALIVDPGSHGRRKSPS